MSVTSFADVTVGKEWDDGLTGNAAGNRALPTVSLSGETSYEKLLNLFYPVGTYYISDNSSFDPNSEWGGTWTKIENGRFLQSTTGTDVGTTVEAGLPNITGKFYGDEVSRDVAITRTGAISGAGGVGHFTGGANYNYYLSNGFTFDASKSNAIYGRSSTVQPPSIKVNIWKRVS